jgi:hypothetical protein
MMFNINWTPSMYENLKLKINVFLGRKTRKLNQAGEIGLES